MVIWVAIFREVQAVGGWLPIEINGEGDSILLEGVKIPGAKLINSLIW